MALYPNESPALPKAMELGYEPQTIRVRGLLIFLILFIVFGALMHLFLWKVMKGFEQSASSADLPRSIVSTSQLPPSPNLQPSVGHDALPYQDMEALRIREDKVFAKLGWSVNSQTHAVEIPPEIVSRVIEFEQSRAAGPYIPPTTTGKASNSILPRQSQRAATRSSSDGGQRP